MSSKYNLREQFQLITKKQKIKEPVIRQIQLTSKQKGATKIWTILRDAMRLNFFKTMQKIRNYNFDFNRKKFVNENFRRGYKIDDKKAGRLKPRARTLDPYAQYSRARVLEQITSKLTKKKTHNITISQFDALNLQERITHMEKLIQQIIHTKQQNSKNSSDTNNSGILQIAMEIIKLKKQLAKKQGSEASNKYPQSISNISRQISQGQFTNNSQQNQKHVLFHKNDFSYSPSQKNFIKNIDSRYEKVPQFGKSPQIPDIPIPPKTPIDPVNISPPRGHTTDNGKQQYENKYIPLLSKPIQKPLNLIQNGYNTKKFQNKNYVPQYQPPQYPPRPQLIQNSAVTIHQPPALILQKNTSQSNKNPNQVLQSKYIPQTRNNNYFSPQHHQFGSNNNVKLIEQKVTPLNTGLEQTKPIQKQDRKGKKLNVVSYLPYKKQKQKKAEDKKPPIVFGKGPMKSNKNYQYCDQCGRMCSCEINKNY